MKIILAICILALATPASARPWAAFYCGRLQVASVPAKYFNPDDPLLSELYRMTDQPRPRFERGFACVPSMIESLEVEVLYPA
jgi:hypothetical protein